MKYDLDPDTRAVLAAVIAGEDVECEYYATGSCCWVSLGSESNPMVMAGAGAKLRLKPRTIRIGEYDVPEPMRVAPAHKTSYFVASMLFPEEPICCSWDGDAVDFKRLDGGVCQATKAGAITHGKALRSLTEVKP